MRELQLLRNQSIAHGPCFGLYLIHLSPRRSYQAGIKDVFTCEMVGYAMGARMTQELTAKALWRALRDVANLQSDDRRNLYSRVPGNMLRWLSIGIF